MAAGEGLFSGTSATTFATNEAMTHGMFVAVLGNKAKIAPKGVPHKQLPDSIRG